MSQLDALRQLMQGRTPGQSLADTLGLPPVPPQQAIPAPAYNPDAPKAEAPEWLRRTGNTLDIMGDALSTGVQGAIAAPGNAARGVGTTMGQLIAGNPNATSSAQRTISSVFANPADAITGQEVNQNAGLGSNPIAGAITSAVTDPLLMGAAAKLGAEAPAFMRSVLTRGGAPSVEAAAPAGQTLRGRGLSTYITDSSGQNFIQPSTPAPVAVNRFGASGERLFSDGSTPLSTAEQWTGRRAAMGVSEPATGAASQAGPISGPLGLRRQITVANGLGFDAAGNPTASSFVGGLSAPSRASQAMQGAQSILGDMAESGGNLRGMYDPATRVAGIAEGAPAGTLRHEMIHGLTDVARNTGNIASLPSAQLRNAATLQNSASPGAQALGMLSEEAAAHGAGAGRGILRNLQGQAGFLSNPQDFYADQLSRLSPIVGRAYNSAAIPRVGLAAYGAGAGATAAALQRLLQPSGE